MKLLIIGLFVSLSACVSQVTVHDRGPVDLQKVDANTKPLAPLVMQYKFSILVDDYEITFLDENKKKYVLKVNGQTDTTKGILMYLPTDRAFALAKFSYTRQVSPRRQDYEFGGESNMFKVKSGMVTYIGYFEISDKAGDSNFRIHKPNAKDQEAQLQVAMKHLGFSEPIQKIENFSAY